ncbi:MAG TPA: hypothetical protein PK079_01445 [Leptospiraceae bacterium]|nr:hypothetical protein [Leptospiraceae bacterium]HMW04822.1 hypothetical protein [Leptospiraceae bacterium]HMX34924.1 hypothetical protein [Leptospiraceae bacterium]HMY30430.1 hypothetical protein [Leptospiraceae bacterium]HMZ64664.1 hypothetical protein [Leptospiraceae bacterium]
MRKSVSILLVLVALAMIGCASGDSGNSSEPVRENSQKSDGVESEKQRGIDWIKENYIDKFEQAPVLKMFDKHTSAGKNYILVFGGKLSKTKKATEFYWRNNTFTTRELSEPEMKRMDLCNGCTKIFE